ncbi:MAG: capsular biosynthesis protein, partial [Clostridia bacterium]|nr:capsular biosynthesis protein [Clostridia bacterium]
MNEYKSMLVGPTSPFAIGEAFKEIRTNMLYTARGIQCPIYAVTSDFAHAGKTVISANLAASFAGLGKRVLLIDADLRNPAQHKVFSVERSPGLSEVA